MRLFLIAALCIALIFSSFGCAQMAGLGGRVKYAQTFTDEEGGTVTATGEIVPGQKTAYSLNISGPAGLKWEEITGMDYGWGNGEGNGKITINSASKADTLAQAEAIATVVPILAELMKAGVVDTVGIAAPVVTQGLAGRNQVKTLEIQGKTTNIKNIVDALTSLGYQIKPPAEVPANDVPITPGNE